MTNIERLMRAAELLRKHGYNDEADKVEDLTSVCGGTLQRSNVKRATADVAQTAVELLSELLNSCELNLDDIEPDTQRKIAKAERFLADLKHPF